MLVLKPAPVLAGCLSACWHIVPSVRDYSGRGYPGRDYPGGTGRGMPTLTGPTRGLPGEGRLPAGRCAAIVWVIRPGRLSPERVLPRRGHPDCLLAHLPDRGVIRA